MIIDILQDGAFAAIAGVGFGLISNPRSHTLPYIAILAAIGHSTRYILMQWNISIIFAGFTGALVIGILTRTISSRKNIPQDNLSFPALLPMIPGMYAYGTVQSLIKCLTVSNDTLYSHHLHMLTYNAFMTIIIILMLVVGVFIPNLKAVIAKD